MTDEFADHFASYSSLTTHRECPQRYSYKYLNHLAPATAEFTPERDFGTWWHFIRSVDSLNRGVERKSIRLVPKYLHGPDGVQVRARGNVPTLKDAFAVVVRWWKRLPPERRQQWEEFLGEPVPNRLAYLNRGWRERWAEDLENESPIAVELKWRKPLPDITIDGTEIRPETIMGGYIDEVVYDESKSLVIVRDWKTSGRIADRSVVDDLMDSQLFLYPWGALEQLKEWGHTPQAVSYDRVRITKPKEPQLTQTGALSKSVTDYDLRTYLDWVGDGRPFGEPDTYYQSGAKKGQPKFGTYLPDPKEIDRLSNPSAVEKWFNRTLRPLSLKAMTEHLVSAVESAETIKLTKRRVASERSAARNFGRACGWCDFNQLCNAELLGGPLESYEDVEEYGLKQVRR